MKHMVRLVSCLCILLFSAGCTGSKNEMITREGLYFDTAISISVYSKDGEKVLDGCFELCEELENIFSRTKEGSELYEVNHRLTNSVVLSEDLTQVIQEGLTFYKNSGGKFDITVAPLLELWDFKSQDKTVPDDERIQAAAAKVDGSSIHLSGNTLTFDRDDTKIDLGALAKGYAADKLKEYLLKEGVSSAMINLGGNVLAVGEKPDGSPWKVGIQKPFADRGETSQVLEVRDESVVSSGIYERYFEEDGVLYHHILNPDTGYPADTDYSQVTIVSESSLLGDALSTVSLLAGQEGADEMAKAYPDVEFYYVRKPN